MKLSTAMTAIFFIIFSTNCHAKMYKWVDENGQTHYSDKPHKKSKQVSVGKSGKVQVDKNRAIAVPPNALKNSHVVILRKLLKRKKYKQINKVLTKANDKFLTNIKHEKHLFTAYKAFSIKKESYTPLFETWIKSHPDSYIPYTASAKYQIALAWKARGHQYMNRTSEKGIQQMRVHLENATKDLYKALSLNDKSIVAYDLLLEIATMQGRDEDSNTIQQKTLKMYPASLYVRGTYLNNLKPRWGGSYELMEAFIKESAKHKKDNPRLKLLETVILNDQANLLSDKNDYELSNDLYNASIKHVENYSAYFGRAKNYFYLKKYKKALKDLDQAIALNPEYPGYYSWRAKIHAEQKQYEKAMENMEAYTLLNPYNSKENEYKQWVAKMIAYNVSKVVSEGDTDNAIAKHDEAIKMDPTNAHLYNQRSRLHYDQRNHKRALKDIQAAIELEPDNYNHYLMLDYLVVKSNRDWNLIIKNWLRYIKLKPKDGRAYAQVAGTFYHNRDIESALKYAKQAADMGNNDGKEIYQRLKSLKR